MALYTLKIKNGHDRCLINFIPMFNGSDEKIIKRREIVFLILSGLFIGTLAMLNILGISRFVDLSFSVGSMQIPFSVAIGVLPYPITFLCTDLISEIYGKKRAHRVVWVGLLINIWVLFILWLGGALDAPAALNDKQQLSITVQDGEAQVPHGYAFYKMRYMAFGATLASMIAYMTAQFVDVHVFHFIKKKTQGRMMWLRNNLSTLTSQLIDSIAVILITHFYAQNLPVDPNQPLWGELMIFIFSAYFFKMAAALIDTIPFYLITKKLRVYLSIGKNEEI